MQLPDDVRTQVRTQDPTQPRLTWYGDQPGERVELSGRVLDNWAAKAGNLLQDELDVGPGSVVRIDLPAGHWRAMYWALASWSVGATVQADPPSPVAAHQDSAGPDTLDGDTLVTATPPASPSAGGPVVIAVSLPALTRRYEGQLRSGDIDEAAQLATYDDVLEVWDQPDPQGEALRCAGSSWTFQALVSPDPARGQRVMLPATAAPGVLMRAALSVWAAGGSVVLCPAWSLPRLTDLAKVEGAQFIDLQDFAVPPR